MFSFELWEISHNIFFKEYPSDGCFCIKTSSVCCPTATFRLFKNDVTHIFWLSIFSAEFVGWGQE